VIIAGGADDGVGPLGLTDYRQKSQRWDWKIQGPSKDLDSGENLGRLGLGFGRPTGVATLERVP
jgi:hypothetical protein